MASKNYEEKYTKPDLREQIKEDIKNSDKGGKPGQWSARKSQLLVQEYEKQGGGYKKSQKDQSARSLEAWTEQDWQTIDGKGEAREDGKTRRYLPKKVWDQLSKKEKEEAERTKTQASKDGKQFVPWTPAIKQAFEDADIPTDHISIHEGGNSKEDLYQQAQELDIEGRSQMSKDELKKAIKAHQQDNLHNMSRDELYKEAQKKDISGRSEMSKKELIASLQDS